MNIEIYQLPSGRFVIIAKHRGLPQDYQFPFSFSSEELEELHEEFHRRDGKSLKEYGQAQVH